MSGTRILQPPAGIPPLIPAYISGRYYATYPGPCSALAIGAADIIYLYPFPVYYPMPVKTVVYRCTTGGAASSCKAAIWANGANQPNGAPLIVDDTGQATTAAATIEVNTTDVTLPPGWYWFGTKFTGTMPSMLGVIANNLWTASTMGLPAASVLNTGLSFADTYSNNMPTFTGGSAFTAGANAMTVCTLGIV